MMLTLLMSYTQVDVGLEWMEWYEIVKNDWPRKLLYLAFVSDNVKNRYRAEQKSGPQVA